MVLLIPEAKLEHVDRVAIKKLWGDADLDFACSNAIGASGGLLVIWNKEFLKAESITLHRSFIVLHGVINGIFPCIIVNVYAPNDVVNRRSRLDRFLLSPSWIQEFLVLQWGLHRPISDHCPVAIMDDCRD
ncbi:hypothetical protein RHMOL_Rhmol05G0209800 [Rhododendron molle]|uniref:Uncharacterized protein n=1 Tax=Rhododendron molle TaxID=49168 RepID=A0ACC0NSJ5_RHOML|nr:hypothetical protein RHMOL_Rhmol05G0209800 [Rhododendron molle]